MVALNEISSDQYEKMNPKIDNSNEQKKGNSCLISSHIDLKERQKLEIQLKHKVSAGISKKGKLPSRTIRSEIIDHVSLSIVASWCPTNLRELNQLGALEKDAYDTYGQMIVSEVCTFLAERGISSAFNCKHRYFCDSECPSWQPQSTIAKLISNMHLPSEKEVVNFLRHQWIFTQNQLESVLSIKYLAHEYQKFCLFTHDIPISFFTSYKLVKNFTSKTLLPMISKNKLKIKDIAAYILQPGEYHVIDFFENENILCIFDFSAVKKGEKSDFIKNYISFRGNTNMPTVTALAAARFMNMLSQRIGLITRQHPVLPRVRRFYSGGLAILSENTIRFLECLGITSDSQLIDYKTAKLGKEYEKYRANQGQIVLKGKGVFWFNPSMKNH